jgi:hypothetical protein
VQVDPIKPILKPPGTKHLKVKCDELPSSLAFKFNLRRYNKAIVFSQYTSMIEIVEWRQGLTLVHFSAQPQPFLTQNAPQANSNPP